MVGLPRSIIKKYGVSKKAWAVFRGMGSVKTSSRKTRRSGNMGRRKKSYSRNGGGGLGKWAKIGMFALGGAILAPRFLNIDGKLGAAAGGFFAGGPIGAAVGYFAAPLVLGSGSGAQQTALYG